MSRTTLTGPGLRPSVPEPLPPITLSEGDLVRRLLITEVIDNPNDPKLNMKGWILYQKKKKKDEWQDITDETLASAKAGDSIKFKIDSREMMNLFRGLQSSYLLADKGIHLNRLMNLKVYDEQSVIEVPEDRKELIEKLIHQNYGEEVWNALAEQNPSLAEKLAHANIGVSRKKALEEFEASLAQNKDEAYWQDFFERNTWIFGYGLKYQFLNQFTDQPIYSGPSITGKGAQKGDFLLNSEGENKFTVLVEIKRNDSKIFDYHKNGEVVNYRNGAPQLSSDLVGAVSQLQVNAYSWVTEGSRTGDNRDILHGQNIYTVQPKTILIIGNTAELDSTHKRNTFELYRSSLLNPEVVTFDELFERAKFIVGHSEESLNQTSPPERAKHPAEAGYVAPSGEAEDNLPF